MAEPGRNAPCPCGSKQKYKRCCALGFTADDESLVSRELARLAEHLSVAETRRLEDRYYGPRGCHPEQHHQLDEVFFDWLCFDARTTEGSRLVDRLLHTPGLSRGARTCSVLLRDTAMRLYAFVALRPGRVLMLRDVLSGVEISLPSAALPPIPDPTCLLAARIIVRGASGAPEFLGATLIFPGSLRTGLLEHLRDGLAAFRAAHPHAPAGDEFKALAPILHEHWVATSLPPPTLAAPAVAEESPRAAAELRLQQQYATWCDSPLKQLADSTPRTAAVAPELRPYLLEILRDLEDSYERNLILGEPAFDPSLLWDELGLRETRDGPRDGPPPLGHETIAALVPGLAELAVEVATHQRHGDSDLERSLSQELIANDPAVDRFLSTHKRARTQAGVYPDQVHFEIRELLAHLGVRCNLELYHRKVFWVADELSWMLGTTGLDGFDGSSLRLPFACFALVFTDRYALSLAERMLARVSGHPLSGRILRVVTAYVQELTLPGDRRGMRVVFMCDADGKEWPALVGRDFALDPQRSLVDLLAAAVPGVDAGELAPIWSCIPLRHLFHLVVNTLLRLTRARAERGEAPTLLPPAPAHRMSGSPRERRSSERVFELPGHIDIRLLRAIQHARRGAFSREQLHRCLVRGYHRKSNPGWKDQDERWIKPHFRGPDDAPLVERQYRVMP